MNFFNAKLTEVAIRQMVSELISLNDQIGQHEASVSTLLKRAGSTRRALSATINRYNDGLYRSLSNKDSLSAFSEYHIPASFLVDGYLVKNEGKQATISPVYHIHERTCQPGLERLRSRQVIELESAPLQQSGKSPEQQ